MSDTIINTIISSVTDLIKRVNRLENNVITVPIEVSDEGTTPLYAHLTDAGADIFAADDYDIPAHSTIIMKTGVKMAIPEGFEVQIRPRSGMSVKTFVRVANAPGTIDTGYRDEIGVILTNTAEDGSYHIKKGDKVAQMVLAKIYHAEFMHVNDVSAIGENRGGGFGSTGK